VERLVGRRAVVTGGARGIGAAMARVFVEEGADVAILDLDGDRASATAADIGPACVALATDDASFVNGTYVLADGGIMARLFDLY
jgi:NAD(P)-dependent dehydrogenase (short-subunit alcohol dehydrogenase family)